MSPEITKFWLFPTILDACDYTGMTEPTDTTPTVMQHDIDATRQDATVGVIEAARLLGVTTDAVRARLRRGSLQGHKVNGEWQVIMDRFLRNQQDTTVAQQDTQQSGDRMPTVDLSPLTELIERQAAELQRLAASSAMWQTRAAHLEQQLLAIEATTIAPGSPETNGRGASGIRAWVRRLMGGGDVATK
jgi:hypothetical protein